MHRNKVYLIFRRVQNQLKYLWCLLLAKFLIIVSNIPSMFRIQAQNFLNFYRFVYNFDQLVCFRYIQNRRVQVTNWGSMWGYVFLKSITVSMNSKLNKNNFQGCSISVLKQIQNQIIVYFEKMATANCELIMEFRSHLITEKTHTLDLPTLGLKAQCTNDKHIISNQNADEDLLDEDTIKKKNESKQRYRRLKQKLSSLCCEHQEKSLFKGNKEVSRVNKSRLLTLAIEFEKMTLNQTKDYCAIETKLKEIHKILDGKLENDLLILKQSRFVPAFSALLKKVPTFHKNEFFQSVKTIELGLKLLRIFSTTSTNRDYMISTNQLSTLNSCLSSFIGKQQKKLAIQCLNVLFQLLCSKIKSDSEQIANITIQIIFFGQLVKKLRQTLDNCITQQGIIQQQYVIKCLKYLYIIYRKCFQKFLERPLYQQPQIPHIMQFHLDALLAQLEHFLPALLYDRDQECLKEEELPVCIINVSMYVLKLINLCIHVSFRSAQKIIQIKDKNPFCETIRHLYQYSRENIEGSTQSYELQNIYSEIIDFFGRICCECEENKKALATTGLLEMFYNHPIVYIMDHKLKCLLIPSLCSVMAKSEQNMKIYLRENSAQSIINYVLNNKKRYEQTQLIQMKQMEDECLKQKNDLITEELGELGEEQINHIRLTRKESVSSLNSYTTQCTQNSYLNMNEEDRNVTGLFFLLPYVNWQPLIDMLKLLDG